MRAIKLHYWQSPGDTLVSTAALECLHKQHPGAFLTDVSGVGTSEIFENNPWVTRLSDAETIKMEYPLIHECGSRPVSFLQGYTDFLADKLGVKLVCSVRKPYLYLSDPEKSWMSQVAEKGYKGRFFLISSGGKRDFTCKGWGHDRYQAVVDQLQGRVQFAQVGSLEHDHKPLKGVIDLLGQTDLRQLIRLAWHAQGAVCGVSLLHHVMAAWERPCVTLASGMEPVAWERYPSGVFLHQGVMVPCGGNGCWRSRVVPLGDGDEKDRSLCERPVLGAEPVPLCMALIKPETVVDAVLAFQRRESL